MSSAAPRRPWSSRSVGDTEVGRISGELGSTPRRRSPIQEELRLLVRLLLVVALSLVAITVGLGFARGNPLGTTLVAGIAAAIAAIPEEPPVLLAVILGLGAYRLLRRGVLVRRLNAQETLGAVDLILTDKTGTLTRNRLEVASVCTLDGVVPPGADRARVLLDALRAESDAWQAARRGAAGAFPNAIRRALEAEDVEAELDVADLMGCEPAADGHPYSLVVFRTGAETRALASGAPEAILDLAVGIEFRRRDRRVAPAGRRRGRARQPSAAVGGAGRSRCLAALGGARLPRPIAAGDR